MLPGPCPLPHLSLQVCFPETFPRCKVCPPRCGCTLVVLLPEQGGRAAGGSGALFSGEGGTRAAEAVQTWWRDSAHFLNTERCALMTWTEGRTPGSQVCSQKTGSGRWQSRLPGEAALRSQPPHTHLVTRDGHSPFSFPPQSWRSRKAASAIQLCVYCASHTASSRNRGLMLCKYLLWKLIKCGVDRLGDSS